MSMPDSDTQMVAVYHPGTKAEALVPRISLHQHYMAGWVRIDETTPPEQVPDPEPMSRAAVEADKVAPPADDPSPGPPGDDPGGDDKPPAGKRAGRSSAKTDGE